MVGQIVAVLVLMLFGAAVYMSSKNWRVGHVVLLCGVFLMTSLFVFLSAMSLKTHEAWKKKHAGLKRDIENVNASIAMLDAGDPLNPEDTPDTIPRLRQRLARQLVDRGRIWRGVNPAGVAGESIAVDMTGWGGTDCYGKEIAEDAPLEPEPEPVVEAPAEEPPEAPAEGAAEETDGETPSDPTALGEPGEADPTALGEPGEEGAEAPVEVAEEVPDAVAPPTPAAPRPNRPAGPSSQHGIEAGTVVYAFLEVASRQLAPPQQAALFGESELPKNDIRGACRIPGVYLGSFVVKSANGNSLTMDPVLQLDAQQKQLIGAQQGTWALFEIMPVDGHDLASDLPGEALQGLFPASPYTQAILSEYGRDMQPAVAGDPPGQTMVQVKFLKEHEVIVDSDAAAQAMDGSFDKDGRAVLSYLAQGASTQFAEGDEAMVLAETADKWVSEGICERAEGEPIYVRPLRNYDIMFHETLARSSEVAEEMGVFSRDNETITSAAGKARSQIEFRELEIGKIKEDQENVAKELEVLARYQKELQQIYSRQRESLSLLYRANSQSANGLRGPVQASVGR